VTTDLDIAMREMAETEADIACLVLPPEFEAQLDRIRLDMAVSSFVNLTPEMCKWVILAWMRSAGDME